MQPLKKTFTGDCHKMEVSVLLNILVAKPASTGVIVQNSENNYRNIKVS